MTGRPVEDKADLLASHAGSSLSAWRHLLSILPLIAAALCLQLAAGSMSVAIPVGMALGGQSQAQIGFVAAAYAAGFLAGCGACPPLIRALGYRTASMTFCSLQACFALAFMASGADIWPLIRFATGFFGAGATIIVEGWVSASVSSAQRGKVFGSYNVLSRTAMIGGQVLGGLAPTMGQTFIAAAALYGLAAIAMPLTAKGPVPRAQRGSASLLQIWNVAPMAAIGCVYVGAIGSTLSSVLPAWGILTGMSSASAGLLSASVQAGSLVIQWPLAALSDAFGRKMVTGVATMLSVVASGALLLFEPGAYGVLFAAFAVIGGMILPLYAISVSLAFDTMGRDNVVGLSGSLLLHWSAGSVVGPMAAAILSSGLGTKGLPLFTALGGLMVLIALLLLRQDTSSSHRVD